MSEALTKNEQVEDLEERIASCQDRIDTFSEQVKTLEVELRKLDESQKEDLKGLLSGLPETSPKGILDKLFKAASPKREQLTGNVHKLKLALEVVGQEKGELILQKRALEKQIREDEFDEEAKAVFEAITAWLESYKQAEASFEELKDQVRFTNDALYFRRAKKLGFPVAYEVIADSHLKPALLNELGMQDLAERVGNLGSSYGPALLQKLTIRQPGVPLKREAYMESPWVSGKQ